MPLHSELAETEQKGETLPEWREQRQWYDKHTYNLDSLYMGEALEPEMNDYTSKGDHFLFMFLPQFRGVCS